MPCTSSGNLVGCTQAVRLSVGMQRDGSRGLSWSSATHGSASGPRAGQQSPILEDVFAPFAVGAWVVNGRRVMVIMAKE